MKVIAEIEDKENIGDGSRTFVLQDEGHTLGNALKAIICRYPDVDFCGYTIPHPTLNILHFRIQSQHTRALDILKRGFKDLELLCDQVLETFEAEVQRHQSENKDEISIH